jgi:c-di-GMP-binding flagellar brake protein YcgR
MISQTEIETLLKILCRDQLVNLGVGTTSNRGWFRAKVVSHEASAGRLVLTYDMDRPTDRILEPGERVIVSAMRMYDEAQSAPMSVAHSTGGPHPTIELDMVGRWQPEDDRRHQARVALQIRANRARRWYGGAWHDLEATIVDLSSRGVGLSLSQEAHVGDRLSLAIPLDEGSPDLRITLEVRHVRPDSRAESTWRAGGLFRNLLPADHERVIRFIFAELRSRQLSY